MFQKGDLCKHFKGETLVEKNIYEVLETGVIYTGECEGMQGSLVVYRNVFQEGKVFTREERDLLAELSPDKQEKFHQRTRVEKLTPEEIATIQTSLYATKNGGKKRSRSTDRKIRRSHVYRLCENYSEIRRWWKWCCFLS